MRSPQTHPCTRVICLALSLAVILQPTLNAQTTRNSNNDEAQPDANGTVPRRPIHDYVPCAFYDGDEYQLRARDTPKLHAKVDAAAIMAAHEQLSPGEARQLWEQVYVALEKDLTENPQYPPELVRGFTDYYQMNSKPEDLVGMTRDQANTHIQKILAEAATQVRSKYSQTLDEARKLASRQLQPLVGGVADAFVVKEQSVPKGQQPPDHLSAADATRLTVDAKDAISKSKTFTPEYSASIADSLQPDTSLLQRLPLDRIGDYFRFLADQSASTSRVYPFPDATALKNLDAISNVQTEAAKTAQIPPRKEPAQFKPPEDISCSMAIMGWKETSDIFGRRVANRYVAIQVTLRNLNTKNEFLVHDIQVAVDTGISADEFGRFQAGRDKLLVRAVAERGKSNDRRNIVLNSLTALGSIAGAASVTAGTPEFKDAVAIFQGSFIPGFTNIFPDHTIEQLNHINDLVFSASNTSKVLVPVQGSVPLVTFIAERPLEDLPFAWCGHPPKGWLKRRMGFSPEQNCDFNGEARGVGDKEQKTGYIDDYHYRKGHGKLENGSDYETEDGDLQKVHDKSGDDTDPEPWTHLHYKNWYGAAVRMLEEHTFVVIGGVHIQEVAKEGKLSNLDCPTLTNGAVDITPNKDGVVSCSVTGEALDKVKSVMLEKGTDKIAGKIKPAKDGNSATLEFNPEDLADKDGIYSLYLVDSSGTETDSGESILLKPEPFIKDVKTGTIDLSSSTPSIALEGKQLNRLSSVTLTSDNDASTFSGTLQSSDNSTDSSRAVNFDKNLKWPSSGDFHLKYTINDEPTKTKDPNLAVKRAATSQSTAPQTPAAPVKPAKKAPKVPNAKAPSPANAGAAGGAPH